MAVSLPREDAEFGDGGSRYHVRCAGPPMRTTPMRRIFLNWGLEELKRALPSSFLFPDFLDF